MKSSPKLPFKSFPSQEEIDALRRKFFVGPGDDDIFRKWGDHAMELSLKWLKNPDRRKIHADISLPQLADMFAEIQVPQHGADIEEVFQEARDSIMNNSVRVNNPRYIGHMTTAVPWFSVVIDILITSMNQNQVKIETALASSFVERQTLSWLHRLVYDREEGFYRENIQNQEIALGNITSGGTLGNLTALTVAREVMLPGVRQIGLLAALRERDYSDIVILASKRVHYSVKKCAGILGIGEQAVVQIPVDDNNHIRLDALEKEISNCKASRKVIMALVGIAGTTETGSIDPLVQMAEIAQREGIWFHVDAAWGGAMLLSEELRGRLKGIEQANSVVIDGHKLFYLALAQGAVLFKDLHSLDKMHHHANYILRKGSVDLGRTSIEGSRRFNALKLWFSLKILGMEGYNILLKKSMQLTELMKNLIDNDHDFERTSDPEICILTYRYIPMHLKKRLEQYQQRKETRLLKDLNEQLNELNVELQKRQRENGHSFVSRTQLESAGYPQEIVVFRIILTNLLTRSDFLKEILEEQRDIGQQICQEMDLTPHVIEKKAI